MSSIPQLSEQKSAGPARLRVGVVGSKAPFLQKRTEGTERADKAAPDGGV